MPSAYHSLGKGLQQHNVLMLATQINLRPLLTALLSSSQTCLVALNHGHLDSENCLLFKSERLRVCFKCYNVQRIVTNIGLVF